MPVALVRALTRLRPPANDDTKAVRRAQEAQRRGDWPAAERLWRAVVGLAPRRAGAWVQLGNMLNELERREEAIAAFEEAGRVDPRLAHAPAGIAGVHERAGRWRAAEEAWREAIDRLQSATGERERRELAHAYEHAALSARNAGAPKRAAELLARGAADNTDRTFRAESLVPRARLLPPGSSPEAAALLRDYATLLANGRADHLAARSTGVATGDFRRGLIDLAPALAAFKANEPLMPMAIGLYEQAGLWGEARALTEVLADDATASRELLAGMMRGAVRRGDLAMARRITRAHARRFGDLILVHELLNFYIAARDYGHARLLARFLRRRWPHSRWHAGQYVVLTARTRSLAEADRLVRAEIAGGRRDSEVEQAYCRAAFDAGHFAEAERRLESYLTHRPDDEEQAVLLGYARANATGIAAAEQYFEVLATRTMQARGPMVGLAHMAMRRRDLPAVFDRWRRLSIVHPEEGVAHVEMARAAYEMRDIARALAICEARLADYPADVTMGEFHAWLLTANGRYEEARAAIAATRAHAGPSWDRAELSIQGAGQLGTLDRDWNAITRDLPGDDTAEAARRFYHVARNLMVAGEPERVPDTLRATMLAPRHLPWLHPYLAEAGTGPDAAAIAARWRSVRQLVDEQAARWLKAADDVEITALMDRPRAQQPTVHIVNKFEQPRGGSELHALDLAAEIGRYAAVDLWAPEMPHPAFTATGNVQAIDPGQGRVPRGGILVLIGVYFPIASWIADARPERVVFLYNTFESPLLFERIEEVFQRTGIRPELLFCSDMMGRECGLPGRFEPSPTDLDLFSPPRAGERPDRPFTLGRHSRDVVEKHHFQDWRIYEAVSGLGGRSRVLGGTCMRLAFPPVAGLDLLPARNTGIPDFLRGLDAYLYRTSTWVEPWGRVVIEAMACGLPVLAHSAGGYAQAIRHEVNGLLFDTTEEAVRLVRRLVEEPALRQRLGEQARCSAVRLLSTAEMRRLIAFYLVKR